MCASTEEYLLTVSTYLSTLCIKVVQTRSLQYSHPYQGGANNKCRQFCYLHTYFTVIQTISLVLDFVTFLQQN